MSDSARLRRGLGLAAIVGVVVAGGCADVNTDPLIPATIELAPLAFPSIAIGDVLRDTLGVEQPVRAIVRNINGDIIEDAPLNYLYVQFARDSALTVEEVTGRVRAEKQPSGTPIQIAARFENALQILIPIRVTNAPDTVFRTDSALLVGFVPDSGRRGAEENSVPVSVRVQYRNAAGALANVGDWLVRFAVVRPANLRNDTTQAVFLVNDTYRASQIDTTGTDGLASRRVRVRASQLPAGGALLDTVEVEAMVVRQGEPVSGAPIRILVPVCASSTRNPSVVCPVSGAISSTARPRAP